MKKYLKILLSLWLFRLLWSFSFANEYLDFSNFVEDMQKTYETYPMLTTQMASEMTKDMYNYQCYIQYFDTYVVVSPICFVENGWLSWDTEKSLDYLFDDFQYFFDEYSENSYNFYYNAIQPYYIDDLFNSYVVYYWSLYEKVVASEREKNDKLIRIDNSTFAKIIFKNYSFYVVPTYLAGRWPCSLNNYRIAVEKLNWYYMAPWEQLTLNDLIKNNPKSCKWKSTQSFLFYGWSCGSSTQLFRLSLIMPYLTTIERSNHSKWRALYYWINIMWDDAAMYQNSERFTVRNDFDVPIYFRVYEQWDVSYLVWIVPKKVFEYVEIFKETTWLKSSVSKWIFDVKWNILDFAQYDSRYLSVTYSKA